MAALKKSEGKRSEIVKKSLMTFFLKIKRAFMFRQYFVMKYKQTYLGIFKPTFKVLWLTKTGALLHFYLKILFWFFFLPHSVFWNGNDFWNHICFHRTKKDYLSFSSWICSLAEDLPHELPRAPWSVNLIFCWSVGCYIIFKDSRDLGSLSAVCAHTQVVPCAA